MSAFSIGNSGKFGVLCSSATANGDETQLECRNADSISGAYETMTTITSWISVSGTGTRTFYLGADSQGSSPMNGQSVSQNVKKVFVSKGTPEIFSFSGNVGWGEYFLRRLLDVITNNEVRSHLATIDRAEEICTLSCARAPMNSKGGLEILYGVRDGEGPQSEFHLYQMKHGVVASDPWQVCQVAPEKLSSQRSTHVFSGGAGWCAQAKRQKWIADGDQGDVARSSFWSICDLIEGIPRKDLQTGGFPQLAKLDQNGPAHAVGVKYYGIPTLFGARSRVNENAPHESANFWVDENFVHLCPKTLEPYKNAQRYARRCDGR